MSTESERKQQGMYGHRDFVCLIGSEEGRAADMLGSIKVELENNALLLEDFPEAV